jgi:carbon storage regulator
MLVLGRRPGESLVIAGDIRITILEIEGERVRIGIEAPRTVAIVREELIEAVRSANLHATAAPVNPALLHQLGKLVATGEPSEGAAR